MATLTVCVFFRDFKTWIFNKQDEKSERDCAVCAFFNFFYSSAMDMAREFALLL